jgi:hypothetical protein
VSGLARVPGNFPGVLRRLGLTNAELTFDLLGAVVPVSIVDTDVILQASFLPPTFGAPASAGELAAPIATTVLADTGQLAAGTWAVRVRSNASTGSQTCRWGKRNAADAAWVWSQYFALALTAQFYEELLVVTVDLNERFRCEVVAAGAGIAQCNIWAVQVA